MTKKMVKIFLNIVETSNHVSHNFLSLIKRKIFTCSCLCYFISFDIIILYIVLGINFGDRSILSSLRKRICPDAQDRES